jgi:3-oxoacyl-[acyl-carrier protein] reductase
LNCVIDTNIRSVYLATQAPLKHMQSGGRIIMLGSAVGERVLGTLAFALLRHEAKRSVKIFSQALNEMLQTPTVMR